MSQFLGMVLQTIKSLRGNNQRSNIDLSTNDVSDGISFSEDSSGDDRSGIPEMSFVIVEERNTSSNKRKFSETIAYCDSNKDNKTESPAISKSPTGIYELNHKHIESGKESNSTESESVKIQPWEEPNNEFLPVKIVTVSKRFYSFSPSEIDRRIYSENSTLKIHHEKVEKYRMPLISPPRTYTARKRNRYHQIKNGRSKIFEKLSQDQRFGHDIYKEQSKLILNATNNQNQIAISICEPTFTGEETDQIRKNLKTPADIIKTWTNDRIQQERRWTYVDISFRQVYRRLHLFIALADTVVDVFDIDDCSCDGEELDDDCFKLWDNQKCPIHLIALPKDGKVTWTADTSYNMQECIFSFLEGIMEQWKRVVLEQRDTTSNKKGAFRQVFTNLVALTIALYEIDHWHTGGAGDISDEDLCDIARLLSIRWRYALSCSNEELGLDEDGRKGIFALMLQLEDSFQKSPANIVLKGKFKFCDWKHTVS